MTYHEADSYAAQLVESGRARVAFVTISATHSGYDVAQYQTAYGSPVKRYRRLTITGALASNLPLIEVKAVNSWRRN